MPRASIRLLGGLEVLDRDGAQVALATRKAQALLAILARRPGEPVPRTRLAGLLWGDRPDEQGRASLRQAVAAIRKALGEGSVAGGGDAVALAPDAADVDVVRIEAAIAAGAPGWPALYGGAFLQGFAPLEEPFDEWLEEARAAIDRRVLDALGSEIERLAAAGEVDAGLAAAERALTIDAAHEPAWRARMRLLAARGDRAAALREYDRCRAALARAVSAPPGRDTERLRLEIAAGAPSAARPGGGSPSLAVVPLEVLSSDPEHVLFARGLAEDVVVALARFRPLRIAAAGSAERLVRDGLGPVEVGRALDVSHVLAGSVRAGGGRLRVGAHLVETASGRETWAERFEGDLADVFALQDRIVAAVASALALEIDGATLRSSARRPAEELDAYACWLRGMDRLRAGSRDADLEARRLFARALERDPSFARAYVGLSLSHFNDWSCAAWERWDENERCAHDYAQEALRHDDRDHFAHVIVARVLAYRREFERAAAHLERALSLNANDPDALAQAALLCAYLGDPERATALGDAARRLHPFHPDWYLACTALGPALGGRCRDALEMYGRSPDAFVDTRAVMAACHAEAGDRPRAEDCARRYLARFRRDVARDPQAGEGAALAWLFQVNPFRREADVAFLRDGLERAGLRGAAHQR